MCTWFQMRSCPAKSTRQRAEGLFFMGFGKVVHMYPSDDAMRHGIEHLAEDSVDGLDQNDG